MPFIPAFLPTGKETVRDWWFVFRADRLLVRETGTGLAIPRRQDISAIRHDFLNISFLGTYNGVPCYSAEAGKYEGNIEGMRFEELRSLLGLLEEDVFSLAGRAFQIINWYRTTMFCGSCGSPTQLKTDERAKTCPECGLVNYPAVSPAIIVAVIKGHEILLARSHRFLTGFYSVLAGFVEPGETLEQCVTREVREEAGIKVGNIRYFGSQPWPFPHTLMVGFTADYESGEIVTDGTELADAGWFRADELPALPRTGSIARRLIDWFAANPA
jgi:NAD+ diphosphatase